MQATDTENQVIAQALAILAGRCRYGEVMASPATVRHYLTLRAGLQEREVFTVMFLDSQNRIIATEDMFSGTLTQASVYPREVAKRCLQLNAAAVVLSHNHPSGSVTPSRADEALTRTLKTVLELIDVRVLDHVVTGGGKALSMAEMGLI